MPVIWVYKGPKAGQIVEATQEEVDAAEAAGWGQDMSKYAGHQLIVPQYDEPIPQDPGAEPNDHGDDPDCDPAEGKGKKKEYKTRHLEAEPAKRGRQTKSKE